MNRKSDRAWESFGRTDPYFGVLSHDRFHRADMEGPDRREFFATGEAHIDDIGRVIHDLLGVSLAPRRALDFGCGVGRVVIPLSRISGEVVGMDVSPSMLREAQRNCQLASVGNVHFLPSDDQLSQVNGAFDFIHSHIVFQHIPPRRGEMIIGRMLDHLEPGGVGAIHLTYSRRLTGWRRFQEWALQSLPLVHNLANVLRGRSYSYPLMQMNDYDLNRVLKILQEHACRWVHLRFSDHAGFLGVMMFFKRDGIRDGCATGFPTPALRG